MNELMTLKCRGLWRRGQQPQFKKGSGDPSRITLGTSISLPLSLPWCHTPCCLIHSFSDLGVAEKYPHPAPTTLSLMRGPLEHQTPGEAPTHHPVSLSTMSPSQGN